MIIDGEDKRIDVPVLGHNIEVVESSALDARLPTATMLSQDAKGEHQQEHKADDAFDVADVIVGAPPSLTPQEERQKEEKSADDKTLLHGAHNAGADSRLPSFLYRPTFPKTCTHFEFKRDRVFYCKSLHKKTMAARHTAIFWIRRRLMSSGRAALPLPKVQLLAGRKTAPSAYARMRNIYTQQRRSYSRLPPTMGVQRTPSSAGPVANTTAITSFIPPIVPKPGIYNMMNNYNNSSLHPYYAFLRTLGPVKTKPRPEDMQYTPLPPDPHSHDMDEWLRTLLPTDMSHVLWRDFRQPARDEFSVLARCIRYASSPAQHMLSWVVHPVHVALIVERTNRYGIALMPEANSAP